MHTFTHIYTNPVAFIYMNNEFSEKIRKNISFINSSKGKYIKINLTKISERPLL